MFKIVCVLLISVALGAQQVGLGSARTITSSGTAVRLAASRTLVRSFTAQAKAANTGVVYLGGANVLAASANGVALTAGVGIGYVAVGERKDSNMYDLNQFWVDSTISGDIVLITYVQ